MLRRLPPIVDSSEQFKLYKREGEGDVTYKYFEDPNNINVYIPNYRRMINYSHSHQFVNYSNLEYQNVMPLIQKYFTPSAEVRSIIQTMETKYQLDYSNLCVLFYRGNDKITETTLCRYEEYLAQAKSIQIKNPDIKFLIQSDETEFIDFMLKEFPSSIVFYDEIRHMNKCVNTVDIVMKENIDTYSKNYLAITVIMSKCKYIVFGSGNCSIWIVFYRGHNRGVFQNLNGRWFINYQ
jgi:hypothetical protein